MGIKQNIIQLTKLKMVATMIRLRLFSLLLLLVNFSNVFSMQAGDYIKHKVEKGQTIYAIGRLYEVSPVEILKLNPDAQNGIEVGQIVLVPASGKVAVAKPMTSGVAPVSVAPIVKAPVTSGQTHTVEPKETLYGLSKKYGVTIEQLTAANPELAEGLKIGQVLQIPSVSSTTAIKPVEKISAPTVVKTATESAATVQKIATVPSTVVVKTPVVENPNQVSYEQVSAVSNTSELSLNDPSRLYDRIINKPVLNDLLKSANKEVKKELVLLLPFNLTKIQSDTVNNLKSHLNKDRFLNMTLDFYSGALTAIDSAGKLGLKIHVRILDSEESQSNANMAKVIGSHDFSKVHGVIGPFRQANIELVAEALAKYNIPIVSPLSKESAKLGYANLYNSIPPIDVLKKAIINYVKSQNANVIAVVDAKKVSSKQYLSANFNGIKFATVDEANKLNVQSLKDLLVAGKMNYVFVETERAGLLLTTINTLTDESLKDYQINLATTDRNPTFDHEEIPLSKLVKLQLHYPSITRENAAQNTSKFSKRYKKENSFFPNQYAIRGFDLTFDAILRLAQDISFEQTVEKFATEYHENRFSYDKDLKGGYFNRGVFVLRYNDDYTIKELK